ICNANGEAIGAILREQEAIDGQITSTVQQLRAGVFKVTVRVENRTPLTREELDNADEVLKRTLASTNTVLHVEGGEFVSLMDPGAECKSDSELCRNIGTWPVLVGEGEKQEPHTMLSSPIILSDYPELAPESAGPLCDATEIDEILTL